jgi:hypothetical protein
MASQSSVLHIGYPKAASTFLQQYLDAHPEVSLQIVGTAPMVDSVAPHSAPPISGDAGSSVCVYSNEKIAESLIITGDRGVWRKHRFTPGAWDIVDPHINISPFETARRFKQRLNPDRVLILIRDQVEWLQSSYKYFLPRLPPRQRAFADFCATPLGRVYLMAGHVDRLIEAYQNVFGRSSVSVIRVEEFAANPIMAASSLCRFLGVQTQPFPPGKANEGSKNNVAVIHRRFPIIERAPAFVRKAGSAIVSRLSSDRPTIFSRGEIEQIQARYRESNCRANALL